ncbi:MAG: phosphoenolpyruvate synthase, partial [Spirochaetes bacterium]|nr:phosphoenolpyruvate synthase [Spirochaetota bacterium]
ILALLDLSIDLESVLFKIYPRWKDDNLRDILKKCGVLSIAAAGCGFIELIEWDLVSPLIDFNPAVEQISIEKLGGQVVTYRRLVDWSTAMVRAQYMETAVLYNSFEPLVSGFIDDRVRSSIALHFGNAAALLEDFYSRRADIKNNIFNLSTQNQVRGMNPGFARGKLNVIAGNFYSINFSKDGIYVLMSPPANLKPVAGIATVSEGNAVSHVQLLARNLGIPNAVLSQELLEDLQQFYGMEIFFAVSPRGTVIMKKAEDMDQREKDLFIHQKTLNGRIAVPVKNINLKTDKLLSLNKIRARHSGIICGPKAANLGELRYLFPENVAPGFVIPFGIFNTHMRQKMPDSNMSYMDFLAQTFAKKGKTEEPPEESEKRILSRLSDLREAIKKMPVKSTFIDDMRTAFEEIFDAPSGGAPVFIRSDTNVEDLKDFTGAGLNLTVPNVVAEKDIFQAIRDVWASPYTERSYMWRQRFLTNPEHVYPSILVLKSINCNKSGVVITTGLNTGHNENITVSFSRGVGGAVEGQSAEMYEVYPDGKYLFLSPSREPVYKTLPRTGGIKTVYAAFSKTILNKDELEDILDVSKKICGRLPFIPEIGSKGPYDIEMGFINHKLWLFQARPFVENRAAKSSEYLRSLDPVVPKGLSIMLDESIKKSD